MGVEIERKYLVTGDGWREAGPGTLYRQGYLCTEPGRTVRVRIEGERAFLTVKSRATGLTRLEFEYAVPVADAQEMLGLCPHAAVEKVRTKVPFEGHVWEVDEYRGDNAGLVIAECELVSEDEAVELPGWVGEEVTGDHRYANSQLAVRSFRSW
ncbi:MAG: CYTH domain-containing protein [bacterium]|nr:CYTH domain-containing protein [bacterium]